jgi:predicted dehydrogenase
MAEPPRIGMVGPGRWGQLIVRDLVALGAEVWAVALSPESAAAAKARGAAHLVGSVDSLPELDGYVIATPEKTHLQVIEALLPRGRPMFVEKPLDVDLGRARALPAAARDLVFVMHKWRYHPGIEAMAEIVRSHELGPAVGLALERLQWGGPKRETTPLWVLAPHDLSIALHILGEVPRPVWAVSHPQAPSGRGAMALLETSSGQRVSINFSYDAPAYQRNMALGCALGAVHLADPLDDHLTIIRPDLDPERRPISTEAPLLRELRVFLEHLDGGPKPLTSLEDEIAILEALDQISQMTGGRA